MGTCYPDTGEYIELSDCPDIKSEIKGVQAVQLEEGTGMFGWQIPVEGMMRVIGYARVSTGDQGLSLSDQCTKIRVHCELMEYDLIRIYQDKGESGRDLRRRGIRDAMFELTR